MSSQRRKLAPPDGKPLIVHVVVNVEHWQFDQPMPRKALTSPHGAEAVPDVPNFSWAEYGMRVGMPRRDMMSMLPLSFCLLHLRQCLMLQICARALSFF